MKNSDTPASPFKGQWTRTIANPDQPNSTIQCHGPEQFSGLSKREWFAGLPMSAIIAKTPITEAAYGVTSRVHKAVADDAVCYADAILERLEKING